MAELKPCKCGDMPERQWSESFIRMTYLQRFACPKCGVFGCSSDSTSEAIEAWNREVGDGNG